MPLKTPFRILWHCQLAWLIATYCLLCPFTAMAESPRVALLTVADAIGPATEDYIERAFEQALAEPTELIILRLDTPGGLDGAMRGIIKRITASPVPVVSYVSPTGARAASAGTYILYASHVAAMAPGTNLGAATPVQIGGISLPGLEKEKDPETEDSGVLADSGDAMKRKMVNDASAYIRALAELHGRNAEWAEKAVRDAVSLRATEALRLNVIDIVATDIDDLLKQIDGREVLVLGQKRSLVIKDLTVVEILPDWRNRLLSVITNPNIAYILMMIGIYGLILEFYNPGGLVPGIVGAICLVLAMYSFQLLPVNYAGVVLIMLGIGLMVAEAFQPSFGMLGIGGVIAFIIGSIILMDTEAPNFQLYLSLVVSVALATLLFLGLVVSLAIRSRGKPLVSGVDEMIGQMATVVQRLDAEYVNVHVHGELWRAKTSAPLLKGQQVKITSVDGLTLSVDERPAELPPHSGSEKQE